MSSVLTRDLLPAATVTRVLATPSHCATTLSTDRLASPLSATARTRTLSAGPSAVCIMPSMPSCADLGVTRASTRTPVLLGRQGLCAARHHTNSFARLVRTTDWMKKQIRIRTSGRDVDAAEIGQQAPDRPQHRLGQGIEPLPQRADELVVGIDHIERDQPAHHGARNDDVDIERDHVADEAEQLEHGATLEDRRSIRGVKPSRRHRQGPAHAASTLFRRQGL